VDRSALAVIPILALALRFVFAASGFAKIGKKHKLGREARILTAKLSFLLQDIEKGIVR
jgi:hypothetical protein